MSFDASRLARLGDTAARSIRSARGTFAGVEHRTAGSIADTARSFAPVLTGELRAGIRVVGSVVESTAEHSAYVEYGTAFADAQPYMNPAADRHEGQMVQEAEDEAVRLAERALGG